MTNTAILHLHIARSWLRCHAPVCDDSEAFHTWTPSRASLAEILSAMCRSALVKLIKTRLPYCSVRSTRSVEASLRSAFEVGSTVHRSAWPWPTRELLPGLIVLISTR